ncbi:MAG: 23S rRNA (guanine(745)-N(1))-methyltransferase [Parashewanella sp.]
MSYICPLCAESLTQTEHGLQCPNKHSFDRAKEGYVNLLPVQKKSSKAPGDNKLMMQARREFLQKGFYQHLSDRINEVIVDLLPADATVLDLGCGEGYYTSRLNQALNTQCRANVFGLDISKVAIRYASKRHRDIQFCVASAFETPFADGFFDALLRIYAPSKGVELQRLIKRGGYLVTVTPGPQHHWFLKTIIYQQPKPHDEQPVLIEGFELQHVERLQTEMTLIDTKDISNFLNMTPYAWKLSEKQKTELQQGLVCELDFIIQIHRRT